jgi:hypothetical protein
VAQRFQPVRPRNRSTSLLSILHRTNGLKNCIAIRPGPVDQLCDQPALPRDNRPAIHNDFKLTAPALFERNILSGFFANESSETRRLFGVCPSSRAMNDFDIHDLWPSLWY